MRGLNKVCLIGNIGFIKETKKSFDGKIFTNLSLATHRKIKGNEYTEWFYLVCFSKFSEYVDKYLSVGDKVFVEGRLVSRYFQDKNNQKRIAYDVICNNLSLVRSNYDKTDSTQEKASYKKNEKKLNSDYFYKLLKAKYSTEIGEIERRNFLDKTTDKLLKSLPLSGRETVGYVRGALHKISEENGFNKQIALDDGDYISYESFGYVHRTSSLNNRNLIQPNVLSGDFDPYYDGSNISGYIDDVPPGPPLKN